jgi:hypothetical protein
VTSRVTTPTARRVTGDGVSGGSGLLPGFTKLGVALANPSWLATAGNRGPYFPRLFENDLHRSVLSSLPTDRFSILYSSDHGTTTGYIGRADTDSIETIPWTDSGAAVLTGADQLETPFPIYDAAQEKVLVYFHDQSNPYKFGFQNTQLYTTEDLDSFSYQNEIGSNVKHSGYAQVIGSGNFWVMRSIGDDGSVFADALWYGTSPDRLNAWPLLLPPGQATILPPTKQTSGTPFVFQYGGKLWRLTTRTVRPQSSTTHEAFIAYQVASDGYTPLSGYQDLILPGGTDDADRYLIETAAAYVVDGTLYILYIGQNTAGENSIMLAKGNADEPTQTSFLLPVNSSGKIARSAARTLEVDWVGSDGIIPDATATVVSGTNNSTAFLHGYELRTGSGSAQDIAWDFPAVQPTTDGDLEFSLNGISASTLSHENGYGFEIGLLDDLASPTDGFFLDWSVGTNGTLHTFADGVEDTENLRSIDFWVNTAFRDLHANISFRVSENGERVTLFLNDSPAYSADISSSVTWGSNVKPYIRIKTGSTHADEFFLRFERLMIQRQGSGTDAIIEDIRAFENFPASFSCVASGGSSYQWQKRDRATKGSWLNVSGATSSVLSFANVSRYDAEYEYRCVVDGSVSSNRAFMFVSPESDIINWMDLSRAYNMQGATGNARIPTTAVVRCDCQVRSSPFYRQLTVANQPTIGSTTYNGRKSVVFDGNDTVENATTLVIGDTTETWFCVFKRAAGASRGDVYQSGSSTQKILYTADDSTLQIYAGTILAGTADVTELGVATAVFNGSSSIVRWNGTEIATGNAGTRSSSAGQYLGGRSSESPLDGEICEVIRFRGVLPIEKIQAEEAALMAKWGIGSAVSTDSLLLEDGDGLLLETGDKLLLEA